MAATLRRKFRYPGDEDEGHGHSMREELDEEEQDEIIQNLHQRNDRDNRFYHTVFTAAPLVATIAYVPALISSSATFGEIFIYVVCILSLSVTAYIMKSSSSFHPSGTASRHENSRPIAVINHPWSITALNETNRKYLVYINSVLCALLAFGSLYTGGTVLYLLPGVFLAITFLARHVITGVDIEELEKLRYEYKGA